MGKTSSVLKRAFGGGSPREVWRKHVLRGQICTHCQTSPAVGTVNIFWPAEEFEADLPRLAAKMAIQSRGSIPFVEFKFDHDPNSLPKKYIPLPVVLFCEHCRTEVEKWAGKAPSYAVVEFRDGPPDSERVSGQVPRAL